ncbi:MAG: hypothetical protein M3P18_25125, partial [Actinomycetota bacterium]|nr:hypothetical protein [Actinomycetota bacterium]
PPDRAAGAHWLQYGSEHGRGRVRLRQSLGNGPREQGDDPPGIPLDGIAGLTPSQAFAAATAQGHVVVFNLSDGCVCVPPTGYGPVAEGWWGWRGQLISTWET